MPELLPVVDRRDRVREFRAAAVVHKKQLRHREIVVYLFTPTKRIFVQRRDGGVFDHSVAGHVRKGETYLAAAIRELEEEVGLRVKPRDLIKIGKFFHRTFSLQKRRYNDRFFNLYVLKRPVTISELTLDPHEVEAIVPMTIPTIRRLFRGARTRYKGGFPISFRYFHRWWKTKNSTSPNRI